MTSLASRGAVGGVASSRVYTGSDDEDGEEGSSVLLVDLAAMFPNIDHTELVTVFRSHKGDVDATVDYLMALSLHKESGGVSLTSSCALDEGGQFSSEIGGLPEVLPSFMTQTDSDSDEEDVPVNQARDKVNSDEDPLPTYDEAMDDEEGYLVAGSILLPVATTQTSLIKGQPPGSGQPQNVHNLSQKKKSKYFYYSVKLY